MWDARMLTYNAMQFIEFCTVKEYGFADWISAWNTLDIISYIAQVHIPTLSSCQHFCDGTAQASTYYALYINLENGRSLDNHRFTLNAAG